MEGEGITAIGKIIKGRLGLDNIKPKRKTNKYFLIAQKIADATGTKPQRWLREVKNHEHACERALNDLRELQARNAAAYFLWLLKKHKGNDK